jgi:hypothetical protein
MDIEIRTLDYGGRLIQNYWVGRTYLGHEIAIRHVLEQDGEHWRFSHVCTLKNSGMLMRIAPDIQLPPQYESGHSLISLDPLHIEPSILCIECGLHGWVRDGKWVSA